MLLVYCIIAAIPVGYVLGGRLSNYLNRPLKLLFLPSFAFLIEASFGYLSEFTSLPASAWLPYAVIAEYTLLALFIWSNRHFRGVNLLGIATLINFAAISSNGFRMPVSPLIYNYPSMSGFIERIESGSLPEYVLVDWNAPLWFLGDTIPLFDGLASIGDLLMAAALFIMIIHFMKATPPISEESSSSSP